MGRLAGWRAGRLAAWLGGLHGCGPGSRKASSCWEPIRPNAPKLQTRAPSPRLTSVSRSALPHTTACPPAERTVALLVFEDVKASPLADLMDVAQRQKTASELNAAILASQSQVGWGGFGDRWAEPCQPIALVGQCTAGQGIAPHKPASLSNLQIYATPQPSAVPAVCALCVCGFAVPQEAEPKLPNLLKLLIWAQKQLGEKALFPRVDNLVSGELAEPAAAGAAGGAGD